MRCGDHQYDLPTRFIELAGEINGVMPKYVVDRLVQGLNLQGKPLKDSLILLLGRGKYLLWRWSVAG